MARSSLLFGIEPIDVAARILLFTHYWVYCNDHCWLVTDEQVERINGA
jgi:hypothetical protein